MLSILKLELKMKLITTLTKIGCRFFKMNAISMLERSIFGYQIIPLLQLMPPPPLLQLLLTPHVFTLVQDLLVKLDALKLKCHGFRFITSFIAD